MAAGRSSLAACFITGLLLSACGSGGEDGPGSVSVDEAQALDDAAEMLDERRLPEGVASAADPAIEVEQEEAQEKDQSE